MPFKIGIRLHKYLFKQYDTKSVLFNGFKRHMKRLFFRVVSEMLFYAQKIIYLKLFLRKFADKGKDICCIGKERFC